MQFKFIYLNINFKIIIIIITTQTNILLEYYYVESTIFVINFTLGVNN